MMLRAIAPSLAVSLLTVAPLAAQSGSSSSETRQAKAPPGRIAYRSATTTPNENSRLGRDAIYVIAARGGEPTEILSGIYGSYDPLRIRWVPGREAIVTCVDVPQAERFGRGVFPSVHFVQSDGDESRVIGGSGKASEFAISPDGKSVAYVQFGDRGGSEIVVSTVDGSGVIARTEGSWKVWDPCWSPDGRFVVHRAGLRAEARAVKGSWGLYRLDVKKGTRKKFAKMFSFVKSLPGGDSLLVLDYTFPSGPKKLLRLDIATGKTTTIFAGVAPVEPALSVDGAKVAFVRVSDKKSESEERANEKGVASSGQIAIVGIGGKGVRDVARGSRPTWSPDGAYLAYERGEFIYVMNLLTKTEEKLVRGTHPSWSRGRQ